MDTAVRSPLAAALARAKDPVLARRLLDRVKDLAERFIARHGRPAAIMEVCGSHTHALAETGIKDALRGAVRLISGPGCPVCVTDQAEIDAMIALAEGQGRIIATFGDMLRVPGSSGSLMKAKVEKGADVRVVYSPSDAVRIAAEHPDREVIFLGVGFETTIPILAAAVAEAEVLGLRNFSLWMSTNLVEPVMRHLLESGEVRIDGFLLPGHVATVIGRQGFLFLAEEYRKPGVIAGFEVNELLSSLYLLLELLLAGRAEVLNNYPSVVREDGNPAARRLMERYFVRVDQPWREMGVIPQSGMDFREAYARFDAKRKFPVRVGKPKPTACRCGEVVRGLIEPDACPLFGRACTPEHAIGPCMVSSEGACAAHYKYLRA
ncbi:MAG: hydrogenase formation protein HypD [Hydrogenibacillus schlegelii]|nr:hydrogenase formation protein HypD [Hydrogenibacillus schlegelii]